MTLLRRSGRRHRRLALAVPAAAADAPPRSGHGRVWSAVMAHLRELARVDVVEPDGRPARHPDAWLCDHRVPAAALGAPIVVGLHEAPWENPAVTALLDPRFVALLEGQTHSALAAAARVVVPTEAGRREVAGLGVIGPERVHVVGYGVDHDVFRPLPATTAPHAGRVLADAGGAGGRPFVLFVGTTHPRKNLLALRAAVGALGDGVALVGVVAPPSDRPDAHGLYAAALAPQAGLAPVCVLADLEERQLAAVMSAATLLCLPSVSEGWGLPVGEAMACGTVPVVSGGGSLPEVVQDAGLVVEPPAPAALAEALQRLLTDAPARAALRERALARAATLTWEATAAGWLAVVRRAIDEHAGG